VASGILHGFISQKIVLFITTDVRTSNHTYLLIFITAFLPYFFGAFTIVTIVAPSFKYVSNHGSYELLSATGTPVDRVSQPRSTCHMTCVCGGRLGGGVSGLYMRESHELDMC
jgi:hypothetical protein